MTADDIEESQSEPSITDTIKEKTSMFFKFVKENLIKFWMFLDSINFIQVFTMTILMILGIIVSAALLKEQSNIGWMYFLIALGVILGGLAWYFATKRYMKGLLYYVVEQKYTRKIIAGGSFSYFEYKDLSQESLKTKFIEPISLTISSLIAMLGIATTVIGLIRLVAKNLDTTSPIVWGIVAILTPLFATPILPVIWSLNDARVKSWAEGKNTTWMVSAKYKTRFNSFIAVSAILSNLREGLQSEQLIEQLQLIFDILKVGAFVILITITLLVAYYYVWFRSHLRKLVKKSLGLKTYTIHLVENEKPQFDTIEITDEPETEPDMDEPVDDPEEKADEPTDESLETSESMNEEAEDQSSDVNTETKDSEDA